MRICRSQRGEGWMNRKTLATLLPAAALCGLAAGLWSESMTLTSFFPPPVGVYNELSTKGTTVLAKNSDVVVIGKPSELPPDSGVKLDLGGLLRLHRHPGPADPLASDPMGKLDGSIYYNSAMKRFRVHRAGAWTDPGKGVSGKTAVYWGQAALPLGPFPITLGSVQIKTRGGWVVVIGKASFWTGNALGNPQNAQTDLKLYRGNQLLDNSIESIKYAADCMLLHAQNLPAGTYDYRLQATSSRAALTVENSVHLVALAFDKP